LITFLFREWIIYFSEELPQELGYLLRSRGLERGESKGKVNVAKVLGLFLSRRSLVDDEPVSIISFHLVWMDEVSSASIWMRPGMNKWLQGERERLKVHIDKFGVERL